MPHPACDMGGSEHRQEPSIVVHGFNGSAPQRGFELSNARNAIACRALQARANGAIPPLKIAALTADAARHFSRKTTEWLQIVISRN
jgi:hypothetical protein